MKKKIILWNLWNSSFMFLIYNWENIDKNKRNNNEKEKKKEKKLSNLLWE